jgi:hypothetical protein
VPGHVGWRLSPVSDSFARLRGDGKTLINRQIVVFRSDETCVADTANEFPEETPHGNQTQNAPDLPCCLDFAIPGDMSHGSMEISNSPRDRSPHGQLRRNQIDQENRKMRVDWGGILLISIRLLPTRGRTPAVTQDVPKQVPVGFCRIQFRIARELFPAAFVG